MLRKKDCVSVIKGVHKQKLCNLQELYTTFKEKLLNVNIGFSKFCTLRPKWCVLAGSKMTHSVCVCSAHQNFVLLVDAMDWDLTYKDLITKIVSNPESNKCMMHRCESCLTLQFWMNFLIRNSTNMKMIKNLIENHYSSLRRIQEILIDAIDDLARYSYIAKCQAQYLKWQKRHLEKIKPLL